MKIYFSGIAGSAEAEMLTRAGVSRLLADPYDWKHVRHHQSTSAALDSGAYRRSKKGNPIEDLDEWAEQIDITICHGPNRIIPSGMTGKAQTAAAMHKLAFVTMPDVFGDPAETWDRWQRIREWFQIDGKWGCYHWSGKIIPVWQWGGSVDHLQAMVEWAQARRQWNGENAGYFTPEADLVAIGGCVPWMRAKDQGALCELLSLCEKWGGHFHILGLNWPDAMMALDPHVATCDTSKWLDGARYGTWVGDLNGRLGMMEKINCPRGQQRTDLCEQSAITLENWLNKQLRGAAAPNARAVRHYVIRPFTPPAKPIGPVNHLLLMHSMAENKKRHDEAKENFIESRRLRK